MLVVRKSGAVLQWIFKGAGVRVPDSKGKCKYFVFPVIKRVCGRAGEQWSCDTASSGFTPVQYASVGMSSLQFLTDTIQKAARASHRR